MSPFRDEQVALIERVARLEDELREARGAQTDHARVLEELRELTASIERAKTQGDAGRAELDELSAAVARIRASVGDPDAAARVPEAQTSAEATPVGGPGLVMALVLAAAVIVGVLAFISQHEAGPKVTKPADATSLAEARREAAKAGLPASGRLIKLKAWYVSSDGTLHSNPAYSPRVEYFFFAPPPPDPASSTPRPIGAPGDPSKMFHDEYAVTLTPSDTRVEHTPMAFRVGAAVPDAHCRLADVWKAAQAAGAPAEAVAIIEYADRFSRGPRWQFEIASTPPFTVDVSDRDCTVMR